MSAIAAPTDSPAGERRWIFGPAPDLLLGCGVGYALLVGLLLLLQPSRAAATGATAIGLAIFGSAHYGATLLRVYEQRSERRKYALFAVWATALVWIAFGAGVYHLATGSLLITIYLTWSPWHYTSQNYGLGLMFLGRRGVPLAPLAKRLVRASFALSYAPVFVNLHVGRAQHGYGPDTIVGSRFAFLHLGIPNALEPVLMWGTGLAYLGATVAAAIALRRHWRALGPLAALAATQAAWFAIPYFYAFANGVRLGGTHVAFLFGWIAIGHAIQYLWITSYYAVGGRPARQRLGYLGKTLAAGCAIWTVPLLLFSPALLGRLSYDLGLALLVAAAVNLHHFILDGAIWKLRDTQVGRVLLAGGQDPVAPARPAPIDAPGRSPWRRALWAGLAATVAVSLFGAWERAALLRAAERGDDARREAAERRLALIGRDEPIFRSNRGWRLAEAGAFDAALAEHRASLALHENAEAWVGIAAVREVQQRPEQAVAAYRKALVADPGHVEALYRFGVHWLERGKPRHAARFLERAARLAPKQRAIRGALDRAREAIARAPPRPG